MRLFKLPAPVLAVILSVAAEGVVFLVTSLFGVIGYLRFRELQDFGEQLFMWFHLPAATFAERLAEEHLIPAGGAMGFMIVVCVFQWWWICFTGIWMLRLFQSKPDEE